MTSNLPPREVLRREYREGATYTELALRHRASQCCVWRRVNKPYPKKPAKNPNRARLAQIAAARAQGHSWRKIGRQLGISHQAAQEYWKLNA